jgi:hypothetical protein
MAESNFLMGYDGQSLDELIALEGEYRVDSLVLAVEQALLQKAGTLSPEEGVVLAVEALEREVNNGGWEQFFINTPEHAAEVASALERIGCPRYAANARRAVEALAIPGEPTTAAIEAALERGGDALRAMLSACDDEYYAIPGEDVAGRLFEFIKASRAAIELR